MAAASHPNEFRKYADACARMAESLLVGPDDRASLHEMAKTWRRLAEDAERFEQLLRDADQAFEVPHTSELRQYRRH
jgi:hypothetical protein